MPPVYVLQRHPAATVRWLRGRLGLTREALAVRLGVPAEAVGKWERGERAIALAAHRRIVPLLARQLATDEGQAFVRALGEEG